MKNKTIFLVLLVLCVSLIGTVCYAATLNYKNDTITSSSTVDKKYTITVSAGAGGTISPNGSKKIVAGKNMTFSIDAKKGYVIDKLTVDGKIVESFEKDRSGLHGTYTLKNIKKNHKVRVTFAKDVINYNINLVFITVKSTEEYVKENGYQVRGIVLFKADMGDGSPVFSFTSGIPADYKLNEPKREGYIFKGWKFDNNSKLHPAGELFKVEANGTTKVKKFTAVWEKEAAVKKYSITLSASKGGKIDPEKTIKLASGKDLTIKFKADEGYVVKSLMLDGKKVEPSGMTRDGKQGVYLLKNIGKNHTFKVTFMKDVINFK